MILLLPTRIQFSMNLSRHQYPLEITAAIENEQVKALFDKVNSGTPIIFSATNDGGWESSSSGGQIIIGTSATKYPVEAFAHELLHAELKQNGYRQYLNMVALTSPSISSFYLGVLSMLDNELQHHKIFSRYLELGLVSKRFYRDSDKNTYAAVRRSVQKMKRSDHPALFLLQFASVIAPGGAGEEKQRIQLRNFIQQACQTSTWQVLVRVESLIHTYRDSQLLDARDTIKAILQLLVGEDKVWFGETGCMDLSKGTFVGPAFTDDEVKAYFQGPT